MDCHTFYEAFTMDIFFGLHIFFSLDKPIKSHFLIISLFFFLTFHFLLFYHFYITNFIHITSFFYGGVILFLNANFAVSIFGKKEDEQEKERGWRDERYFEKEIWKEKIDEKARWNGTVKWEPKIWR